MKIKAIKWGNGEDTDYSTILEHYSNTNTNSIKTSSIPLAQDWAETDSRLREIERNTGISFTTPNVHFEYPTKSYGRNKSSMSDVMIIDKGLKIAIEGKYTEYDYSEYQKIGAWLEEGKRSENRKKVLNHWLAIVENFAKPEHDLIESIPIQFLHRTASACYENYGIAVVVYQVFWDAKSKNLHAFEEELKKSIRAMNCGSNLRYFFQMVTVEDIADVKIDVVFEEMKGNPVYKLGKREWKALT